MSANADLDTLDAYLREAPDEVMTLPELDGYLAAIAIGPEPIEEDEWLPVVWNGAEPCFENGAQAFAVRRAIFARFDDIVREVEAGTFAALLEIDEDDAPLPRSWAVGFMTGASLRLEAWSVLFESEQDDTIAYPILALCEDEEGKPLFELAKRDREYLVAHSADLIAQAVIDIADYWQQKNKPPPAGAIPVRTAPKIGRNDPCPCGSGKKHKKCCGA